MSSVLHYTMRQALGVVIVSVTLLVLLQPWAGVLSDRIGRRPVMALALIGGMLWIGPYFWLLQQHNLLLALLAQCVMTLFAAAYIAVAMVTSIEIIPIHLRFGVVAFAYAVTLSVFGGSTPLIATLLLKTSLSYYGLMLYIVVCGLISLFAVYKVRETRYVPKSVDQTIMELARDMLSNGDSIEKVAAVIGCRSETEIDAIKRELLSSHTATRQRNPR